MVSPPLLTWRALVDHWCQMLEFCKSIGPNLDNYEADGVRCSLGHSGVVGIDRLTSGMAHTYRRLCRMEEGTVGR